MISFWRQLRFLLWKGVLVKRRQKIWLCIELLVPVLLFAILALIRTRDFTVESAQCHYDARGFPSAGLAPFAHNFLCSFSNTCHQSPTSDDERELINTEQAGNESLPITALRLISAQLRLIGEDPARYDQIVNALIEAIKLLAEMDPGDLDGLPLRTVFTDAVNIESELENIGLSPEVAKALADARITPRFFVDSMEEANVLLDDSFFGFGFLLQSGGPKFLCEPSLLNESILLNDSVSRELREMVARELCANVTWFNIGSSAVFSNITTDRLSPKLHKLFELKPKIENLTTIMEEDQPLKDLGDLLGGVDWSNQSEILKAVLCGGPSPLDESVDPSSSSGGARTVFDDIRSRIINYIEEVIPGRSHHPNASECVGVPIHSDLNCSSLETLALRPFRSMLSGYILVTPPAPIVLELIQRLESPLREANYARDLMFDYVGVADAFQDALHDSILSKAAKNALSYIEHSGLENSTSWMPFVAEFLRHGFEPSTDPKSFGSLTRELFEKVNNYTSCLLLNRFIPVMNESAMESAALCLAESDQYFSGLVFNVSKNATKLHELTTYTIRHHPSLVDGTGAVADSRRRITSRDRFMNDLKYLTFGFVYIQEAVERAIVTLQTGTDPPIGVYAQQEPFPCVNSDTFNVTLFLSLFIILSWMIPSALLVKNIVYEKETRLKEMMRIMGLGDAIHFLSWAIISLVLNTLSLIVISALLKYGRILPNTDVSLLLVFLFIFSLSSIAQSLVLSTFFTNANIATACTAIAYFLFFFPFQLSMQNKSAVFALFTLIFPQTALGYGMYMLANADNDDVAHWSTIHEIEASVYEMTMIKVLVGLSLDTIVFIILAWYISAVHPGVYGIGQPFYFCFTRRYWCSSRRVGEAGVEEDFGGGGDLRSDEDNFASMNGDSMGGHLEREPTDLRLAVHVQRMGKVYGSNRTRALDSLTLKLYEGQITALLGHNGAGKTTTMSILCGLFSPSSGTATIYGLDIRRDIRRVRDMLGVCPQHNVLFDLLTVSEQLKFYAGLKGTADVNLKNEVLDIMRAVGLEEKSDALAKTLSGGMKRRLCIGLALVGGSKFVILDEPTAGVDVNSRKDIWRLLQRNKEGRTMLLSTHHMDEADVLADRIAILSEGQLKAAGSSVFLKRRFGDHYELTLLKKSRGGSSKAMIEFVATAHEAGVSCQILDETDEEIVVAVPIETPSEDLEVFFRKLDAQKVHLNITDYGISAPSLQQIFVSLAPHKEFEVVHTESYLGRLGLQISKFLGRLAFWRGTSSATSSASDGALLVPDDAVSMSSSASPAPASRVRLDNTSNGHLVNTGTSVPNGSNLLSPIGAPQRGLNHPTMTSSTPSSDSYPGLLDLDLNLERARASALAAKKSKGQRAWQHMRALLVVRAHYRKRSLLTLLFEVALPVLLLLACELYAKTQRWAADADSLRSSAQPRLPLLTALFGNETYSYFNLWNRSSELLATNLVETFAEPPGFSIRCLENSPYRMTSAGCAAGSAFGEFDRDLNSSGIPYSEDSKCACSPTLGWTCTEDDYPMNHLTNFSTNTTDIWWDLSYRNISQYRLITHAAGAAVQNGSEADHYILGGYSLGHLNSKARTAAQIESEKRGWDKFLESLQYLADSLGVDLANTTAEWNSTAIDDNFSPKNYSVNALGHSVLEHLDTKEIVKVWFNNKAWPSLPIYTTGLYNAVLRALYTNTTTDSNRTLFEEVTDQPDEEGDDPLQRLGIFSINHPMNRSAYATIDSNNIQKVVIFRIVLIALVLCVIPAGFSVFLVEDRKSLSKHLQSVSGVSKSLYWFATYLFDMVLYTMAVLVILLLYWAVGVGEFTEPAETAGAVFVLFLLYGMVAVLMVYLLQRSFAIPALAFVLISVGMFFVGVVTTVTVILVEQLMKTDATLETPYHWCSHIFLLVPQYNLGVAVFRVNFVFQIRTLGEQYLRDLNREDLIPDLPIPRVMAWELMGKHCACLVAEFFICLSLLVLLEHDSIRCNGPLERKHTKKLLEEEVEDEDEDVKAERVRVEAIRAPEEYGLIVRNLSKAYGSFLAVRNVSFAVEKGECFGLLGLNGAGKTTTFGMLTGKLRIGGGEVYIQGDRVSYGRTTSFRQLGYCPQFDALNMKLTAKEQLFFYARIRGINERDIPGVVDEVLAKLHLRPFADTVTANLSGGNKRKLSVAVALLSEPPVILLDEPSAGMDPSSQQFMWSVIRALRKSGRAIVLTSHSMEECDALCSRICLMRRGRLSCIGGRQHLKNKFGEGYSLTLKLPTATDAEAAAAFVAERLPSAQLDAIHCSTVFFRVSPGDASVVDMLHIINLLKRRRPLEDFSLSQTTLDEIFQSFAIRDAASPSTLTPAGGAGSASPSISNEEAPPSVKSATRSKAEEDADEVGEANGTKESPL